MPDDGKNQMQAADRPAAARWRAMIFAAFVFALLALSFHGALDDFAREQVDATTTESISIYALARGINAAISLLQTSEVKAPFLASIQVGALLDPVNDAVERLSSVMVWAIGSLFLQRIVLEIAASPVFKWTFLTLALAAMSALLLLGSQHSRDVLSRTLALSEGRLAGFRGWMIRAFVVAAIVRFIVPAFVSISFLISQMILGAEIEKNHERLSSFSEQVAIDTTADSVDDLREQKARKESELEDLGESLKSLERESEDLERRIDRLEPGLKDRLEEMTPEFLGGGSPGKRLVSAKEKREEISREMARIRTRIEEGGAVVDDLQEQRARRESEMKDLGDSLRSLEREAGVLEKEIDELDDGFGLRRWLPEAIGGESPGKKLASAKERRDEIERKAARIRTRIEEDSETVDDLREQRTRKESEMKDLRDSLGSLEREAIDLEEEIGKLDDEADPKERPPETSGDESPGKALASAKERREEIDLEIAEIRQEIEEGGEAIECIDRQLAGKSCESLADKLLSAGDKIGGVVDMAREAAQQMTMLLVVVVVKNIVIPLVFLSIALKGSLPLIKYCMRLIPNMKQDVKSLQDSRAQTDREA